MFDIGLPEFLVIAMIALIVFGPERLPEMAAQLAKLVKSLRKQASDATAELTGSSDGKIVSDLAKDLRSLTPRGLATGALTGPSQVTASPKKTVNPVFDPDAT
jgi:sec-independent protein translocase protein TatB